MLSLTLRDRYAQTKSIHHGRVLLASQMYRSTAVGQTKTDDYQYIQISKTPTMHFQRSLPHLSVPPLDSTCQKYLSAQKPLLSSSQFEKTAFYVSKFLKEDGPILQRELMKQDRLNRHTNYVSELWFDMYLRDRKPLPINYNPMLVFDPETDPKYNTQLVKATNLIISSLRFMKSLRENVLAPEVFHLNAAKSDTNVFHTITRLSPSLISTYIAILFKAYPLDMSQYKNLFHTTRIPQLEKDKIYQDKSARHLVVMRKGHFYAFDVLDENGYILEPKEIAACLKFILNDNIPANEVPIGILTASERDKWANTRSHLEQIGNPEILQKIDSAIFFMILDDESMGDDYIKLIRNYLHSDGTNRWFDKSFSLIVSADGYAGLNFEHSWGDGVAILRFVNDVKQDISKRPKFHPEDVDHLRNKVANVKRLEFKVDNTIKHAVQTEKQKFDEWTKQLCVDYTTYDGFGKDDCKKFGVSPDAMMQLAFQLAIYNQEGSLVPTYESCSTAAFKHGRTETLRPCTMESKAVCSAMSQSSTLSSSEIKRLIIECSKTHLKLMKEAAMGQGFDRHLFVLHKMAEKWCQTKPEIFEDPAYEYINTNILSTSTLSSPAIIAGGFGPTAQEGYGIGYMIQNKKLGSVVTSYNGRRKASDYVKSLEGAFKSIHKVLAHGQ